MLCTLPLPAEPSHESAPDRIISHDDPVGLIPEDLDRFGRDGEFGLIPFLIN